MLILYLYEFAFIYINEYLFECHLHINCFP